jgi:hypothetical protein
MQRIRARQGMTGPLCHIVQVCYWVSFKPEENLTERVTIAPCPARTEPRRVPFVGKPLPFEKIFVLRIPSWFQRWQIVPKIAISDAKARTVPGLPGWVIEVVRPAFRRQAGQSRQPKLTSFATVGDSRFSCPLRMRRRTPGLDSEEWHSQPPVKHNSVESAGNWEERPNSLYGGKLPIT